VYAFVEKEESSKEEKTCGKDWKVARVSWLHVDAGLCCPRVMPLTRLIHSEGGRW
jgi:hypothetical protein